MLKALLYAIRHMNLNRVPRQLALISCICFAWALISLAPIWKYLSSGKAVAATVLGLLLIALASKSVAVLATSAHTGHQAFMARWVSLLPSMFQELGVQSHGKDLDMGKWKRHGQHPRGLWHPVCCRCQQCPREPGLCAGLDRSEWQPMAFQRPWYGVDSTGNAGYLNDLWRIQP